MTHIALRVRLYPNRKQIRMLARFFGCCRYVHNFFLDMRKTEWTYEGVSMNYCACSAELTNLKRDEDHLWLRECDSTALQSELRSLDDAFQNFFAGRAEYPKFRAKHDRQSYTAKNNVSKKGVPTISVLCGTGKRGAVRLPKLGLVPAVITRPLPGRIISATVSMDCAGRFFASILCEAPDPAKLPVTGKAVGIDLGLKSFAMLSSGERFEPLHALKAASSRLKHAQRSLSRKTKGSVRYEKARRFLAKLSERVADARRDFLQTLSTSIIRRFDVICLEDLDIREMLSKHLVSRDVADASWSEFVRMLEYKAAWYGRTIVKVGRYYPSSQICSHCGSRQEMPLRIRVYHCPQCGSVIDRDLNAARNILAEGLRLLAAGT